MNSSEATKTNLSPDGTNPKEVFKVDDPSTIFREPGEGNDLTLALVNHWPKRWVDPLTTSA